MIRDAKNAGKKQRQLFGKIVKKIKPVEPNTLKVTNDIVFGDRQAFYSFIDDTEDKFINEVYSRKDQFFMHIHSRLNMMAMTKAKSLYTKPMDEYIDTLSYNEFCNYRKFYRDNTKRVNDNFNNFATTVRDDIYKLLEDFYMYTKKCFDNLAIIKETDLTEGIIDTNKIFEKPIVTFYNKFNNKLYMLLAVLIQLHKWDDCNRLLSDSDKKQNDDVEHTSVIMSMKNEAFEDVVDMSIHKIDLSINED